MIHENLKRETLDVALRMANIEIHPSILTRVIDVAIMVNKKGDKATIQDICELKKLWHDELLAAEYSSC